MTKTTVEVLRDAKTLLETKGWTQGTCARNAREEPVDLVDPDASCFCAIGALWFVDGMDSPAAHAAEMALLRVTFHQKVLEQVRVGPHFNDPEGRTLPEVLAKFDEAIAAEEAKLGLEVPA